MKLTDARRLSQDAQEALRLRAIKMVLEDGKTRTEVGKLIGVSRYAVNCWVAKYQQGGKQEEARTPFSGHEAFTALSMRHHR